MNFMESHMDKEHEWPKNNNKIKLKEKNNYPYDLDYTNIGVIWSAKTYKRTYNSPANLSFSDDLPSLKEFIVF